MRRITEGQYALSALTLLAIWLFVALPLLYLCDPPAKHVAQVAQQHVASHEPKSKKDETDEALAYYTLWLMIFTGVLAAATIGLGGATFLLYLTGEKQIGLIRDGAQKQAADTRILQRAYVSVEPSGIRLRVDGANIMGHVAIHNAGNLPARDLSWFVNIDWSHSGEREDFPLGDGKGSVVIVPRSQAIRGSGSSILLQDLLTACGADTQPSVPNQASVYIYVWGIVEYDDGFGERRATRFCHRYNWMMRGNNYWVAVEHARLHEYGNDST